MANPFEEGQFWVLKNTEGQHSLWPVANEVPDGWDKIFGPIIKEECLEFINENWLDMRPTSLVRYMASTVN